MNSDGIIAADRDRLCAYPYPCPSNGEILEITWRGTLYSRPRSAGDWGELLDEKTRSVDRPAGVELDFARDSHPLFWDRLHGFSNVTFSEHGFLQIFFKTPQGSTRYVGPYLPVDAYEADTGDFLLYVPDLFSNES